MFGGGQHDLCDPAVKLQCGTVGQFHDGALHLATFLGLTSFKSLTLKNPLRPECNTVFFRLYAASRKNWRIKI